MAGLSIFTDAREVTKICQSVAALITDAKNARIEYQNSVQSILATEATFRCLKDTIHELTAANIQGDMEVLCGLASEVSMVRNALKEAENVLFERYAAEASPRLWNMWKKRLHWKSTRDSFERCLRDVRERQNRIQILLGVAHTELQNKACKSIAAISHDLNDAPRPIGYPGSGGVQQDHVRLRYGLGLDQFLFLDLCPNPERLQEFLEIVLFANLPGKRHIKKGHYRLYCNPNAHGPKELTKDSWPYLVGSGSSILLAFVVGTWQMSCVNFCPACNRENRADWNLWRNCQCGCLYYVAEAGEVDYKPRDGFWEGRSTDLKEWQSRCLLNRQQITTNAKNSSALESEKFMEEQDRYKHSDDEGYFRCMVMVFDPIWNFECRNVFCRCILGVTSFTSNAPRIEVLSTVPCPKHSRCGIPLRPDMVLPGVDDYSPDPYFDKFGGYKNFKQIASDFNHRTLASAFVDVDKICPAEERNDTRLQEVVEKHFDAVLEYFIEVLSKLRCHWELRMKADCNSKRPELVSDIDTWINERLDEYIEMADSARPIDAERETFKSLPIPHRMIPFLSGGRLTLEDEEDGEVVRPSKDHICAWP